MPVRVKAHELNPSSMLSSILDLKQQLEKLQAAYTEAACDYCGGNGSTIGGDYGHKTMTCTRCKGTGWRAT